MATGRVETALDRRAKGRRFGRELRAGRAPRVCARGLDHASAATTATSSPSSRGRTSTSDSPPASRATRRRSPRAIPLTSSPPPSPLPSWATPRSPERPTYGPAVAALAEVMGRPLMPWQKVVADVSLEVDPLTRPPARARATVTVPRQSGKTVLYAVVGNHRALTVRFGRVWYTMQTGKDGR